MKPSFEFHCLLGAATERKPTDRFLELTRRAGATQGTVIRVLHERLLRKRARTLGQAIVC